MKETGELLKKTRIEKHLTLEEISSQTKIQLHILRSLEEGQVSDFRNIVFVKGFLKQYARALSLDANEVLKMFEIEHSGNKNTIVNTPIAKVDDDVITNKTNVLWFRTSSKFLTMGGILIVFALVTAIYFFSIKLISYSQEARTENPPATEMTVETVINEKNMTLASEANTDKLAKEESLSLPEPKPAPAAEAPSPEKKDIEAPQPPPKAPTKPKMVSVEAFENVEIIAVWNTGKKETVKLKNNGKHIFYYADKIKLEINNAGGIGITTHLKEIGVPGEIGQAMTMNFE